MRKLSVFLVASLLCLMISPAASANTSQGDEVFNILTQESFAYLFIPEGDSGGDALTASVQTVTDSTSISYSYEFDVQVDNLEKADVILVFNMQVGSTIYPFRLEGSVDAFHLSWGDVLWEGPIYGTSTINGTECYVIASFSKIDSNQDVQVCVTVQSKTGMDEVSPVCFTFGNVVLTVEMIEDLKSSSAECFEVNSAMEGIASSQDTEIELNSVDDRYTLIPYSTQYSWYNDVEGLEDVLGAAHTSRAYYYQDAAQIAISVTTNAKKLNAYYNEMYTPLEGYYVQYTSVRNMRIELLWFQYNYDTNLTYIAGMQSFSQSDYANSGSTVLLKAFFDDAMDILGVSTATLSAIFGEGVDGILKGELSCDCKTDNAYVDITIGAFDYVNFDISDPSLAVVFQINTANSKRPLIGNYKYQNSVTYQTLLYFNSDSGVQIPTIQYTSTPNTGFAFNITMP